MRDGKKYNAICFFNDLSFEKHLPFETNYNKEHP